MSGRIRSTSIRRRDTSKNSGDDTEEERAHFKSGTSTEEEMPGVNDEVEFNSLVVKIANLSFFRI